MSKIFDIKIIRVYTPIIMNDKSALTNDELMLSRNCIDFNLRKATRAINQFYDSKIRESGVNVTQHTLLSIISGLQPITITRLSDIAVMDRTTLARNLKLLESKSLVEIKAGQDKRERLISLTRYGTKMLAKTFPIWKEVQMNLVDRFGKEEWSDLKKGLAKLIEFTKEK